MPTTKQLLRRYAEMVLGAQHHGYVPAAQVTA
jgi:hypothetical protein